MEKMVIIECLMVLLLTTMVFTVVEANIVEKTGVENTTSEIEWKRTYCSDLVFSFFLVWR